MEKTSAEYQKAYRMQCPYCGVENRVIEQRMDLVAYKLIAFPDEHQLDSYDKESSSDKTDIARLPCSNCAKLVKFCFFYHLK